MCTFLLAVVALLKVTNCAHVLTLFTLELTSGKNQCQKCDINLVHTKHERRAVIKSFIRARTKQKYKCTNFRVLYLDYLVVRHLVLLHHVSSSMLYAITVNPQLVSYTYWLWTNSLSISWSHEYSNSDPIPIIAPSNFLNENYQSY